MNRISQSTRSLIYSKLSAISVAFIIGLLILSFHIALKPVEASNHGESTTTSSNNPSCQRDCADICAQLGRDSRCESVDWTGNYCTDVDKKLGGVEVNQYDIITMVDDSFPDAKCHCVRRQPCPTHSPVCVQTAAGPPGDVECKKECPDHCGTAALESGIVKIGKCFPDASKANDEKSCDGDSGVFSYKFASESGIHCDSGGCYCPKIDPCSGGKVCDPLTKTCREQDVQDGGGGGFCEGCRIDGVCYEEGEVNPENACEVCDKSKDNDDWSNAANGKVCGTTSCPSGYWCDGSSSKRYTTSSVSDTCQSGTCQPGSCTVSSTSCGSTSYYCSSDDVWKNPGGCVSATGRCDTAANSKHQECSITPYVSSGDCFYRGYCSTTGVDHCAVQKEDSKDKPSCPQVGDTIKGNSECVTSTQTVGCGSSGWQCQGGSTDSSKANCLDAGDSSGNRCYTSSQTDTCSGSGWGCSSGSYVTSTTVPSVFGSSCRMSVSGCTAGGWSYNTAPNSRPTCVNAGQVVTEGGVTKCEKSGESQSQCTSSGWSSCGNGNKVSRRAIPSTSGNTCYYGVNTAFGGGDGCDSNGWHYLTDTTKDTSAYRSGDTCYHSCSANCVSGNGWQKSCSSQTTKDDFCTGKSAGTYTWACGSITCPEPPECTNGQTRSCGNCNSGTQTCSGGTYGTCTGASSPVEYCDGIDNDCNAATADGSGETPTKTDKDQGVCTGRSKVCSGGSWNNNYGSIPHYQATETSCGDGRDNDCDGKTDLDDEDCAPDNQRPHNPATFYEGTCAVGETITLSCFASDPDDTTSLLTVKGYLGVCPATGTCSPGNTDWTYLNNVELSQHGATSYFKSTPQTLQDLSGKRLAATCLVTDPHGASSAEWGDSYPLVTPAVCGGTCTPPDFNSLNIVVSPSSPNPGDTINIYFTAPSGLTANPTVTVNRDGDATKHAATFVSKSASNYYTYRYVIPDDALSTGEMSATYVVGVEGENAPACSSLKEKSFTIESPAAGCDSLSITLHSVRANPTSLGQTAYVYYETSTAVDTTYVLVQKRSPPGSAVNAVLDGSSGNRYKFKKTFSGSDTTGVYDVIIRARTKLGCPTIERRTTVTLSDFECVSCPSGYVCTEGRGCQKDCDSDLVSISDLQVSPSTASRGDTVDVSFAGTGPISGSAVYATPPTVLGLGSIRFGSASLVGGRYSLSFTVDERFSENPHVITAHVFDELGCSSDTTFDFFDVVNVPPPECGMEVGSWVASNGDEHTKGESNWIRFTLTLPDGIGPKPTVEFLGFADDVVYHTSNPGDITVLATGSTTQTYQYNYVVPTSLPAGTYTVRIKATDAAGCDGEHYGQTLEVVEPGCTSCPAGFVCGATGGCVPATCDVLGTCLTPPGIPGPFNYNSISQNSMIVTWGASTSGSTPDIYQLQKCVGGSGSSCTGGSWQHLKSAAITDRTYSDSGLSAATTYYYRVRAENTAGNSGWRTGSQATTSTPNNPPSVTKMSYTGDCTYGKRITLRCPASDSDGSISQLRMWASQCDASSGTNCEATKTWFGGSFVYNNELYTPGVTYLNSDLITTQSGGAYTRAITLTQDPLTGVAATCQATDDDGSQSNWGNNYDPLCKVKIPTCPQNAPQDHPCRTSGCATDSDCESGRCVVYYQDNDDDGYGGASGASLTFCEGQQKEGYVPNNNDCNDNENSIHPGAPEICDGVDNDCDGSTGDGSDETPPQPPLNSGVCENGQMFCVRGSWQPDYGPYYEPNTELTCGDNRDNDCDGSRDGADTDCNTPPVVLGPISTNDPCYPGETVTLTCDVSDDDQSDHTLDVSVWAGQCETDDCFNTRSWATSGFTYANDNAMNAPGSGGVFTYSFTIDENHPTGTSIGATCQAMDNQGDVDTPNADGSWDGDAYPMCNVVICDDPTNPDCDVACTTDAQCESGRCGTYYRDADADGYGDTSNSLSRCFQPIGYVDDDTDCNDADSNINPGVIDDSCDGVDSNCDGNFDESAPDEQTGVSCSVTNEHGTCSGVGTRTCPKVAGQGWSEVQGCDAQTPQEEDCDGLDNDCDGAFDNDDPSLKEEPCGNQNGVCAGSSKLCDDSGSTPDWIECDTVRFETYTDLYEVIEDSCSDEEDNDCDRRTDCADRDCEAPSLTVNALDRILLTTAEDPAISGATIQLAMDDSIVSTDVTGSSGQVVFGRGLANDVDLGCSDNGEERYELIASAPGYISERFTFEIPPKANDIKTFELVPTNTCQSDCTFYGDPDELLRAECNNVYSPLDGQQCNFYEGDDDGATAASMCHLGRHGWRRMFTSDMPGTPVDETEFELICPNDLVKESFVVTDGVSCTEPNLVSITTPLTQGDEPVTMVISTCG